MPLPTGYQYAKLGSNLEYLRGICSASLAETISLDAFPRLARERASAALCGSQCRRGAPLTDSPAWRASASAFLPGRAAFSADAQGNGGFSGAVGNAADELLERCLCPTADRGGEAGDFGRPQGLERAHSHPNRAKARLILPSPVLGRGAGGEGNVSPRLYLGEGPGVRAQCAPLARDHDHGYMVSDMVPGERGRTLCLPSPATTTMGTWCPTWCPGRGAGVQCLPSPVLGRGAGGKGKRRRRSSRNT